MNYKENFIQLTQDFFGEKDLSSFQFYPLKGDASSRRYIRVIWESKSFLLCLNEKENKKHNEEFMYWSREYKKNKIKVPEIFLYYPGFILQEDIGDQTLLNKVSNLNEKERIIIYKEVIDELVKINSLPVDSEKKYDVFDTKKLKFEINMTLDYFLQKLLKVELLKIEKIRQLFEPIISTLDALDFVIVHRDFHSKNIMIRENSEIVIIDFQDCMLGSRQYDLCSLVDDRYILLSENEKNILIRYYWEQAGLQNNYEVFLKIYDFSMIQRTFKAIGSFAYHFVENKNSSYLSFINSSMESIVKTLSKYPELDKLKNSLYSYRYEG